MDNYIIRENMIGLDRYFDERYYCYAEKDLSAAGYRYEKCMNCGRNIVHELPSTEKSGYILDGGKHYPDFLQYNSTGLRFLVSEKVIKAFSENNVTGFDQIVEAPVYRISKGSLEKQDIRYYNLNIYGSIDLNLKAMALKKKHICPCCNQFDWSRQRLSIIKTAFDMDAWDNSDLCRIQSFPGIVVFSEKIKSIVKEYSLCGVRFKLEEEIFL